MGEKLQGNRFRIHELPAVRVLGIPLYKLPESPDYLIKRQFLIDDINKAFFINSESPAVLADEMKEEITKNITLSKNETLFYSGK